MLLNLSVTSSEDESPQENGGSDYSSSDSDSENVTDSNSESDTSSSSHSESSTDYDSESSVERKKKLQARANSERQKRYVRKGENMRLARENSKFNKSKHYSYFLKKMDESSNYYRSDLEELLERDRKSYVNYQDGISYIDETESKLGKCSKTCPSVMHISRRSSVIKKRNSTKISISSENLLGNEVENHETYSNEIEPITSVNNKTWGIVQIIFVVLYFSCIVLLLCGSYIFSNKFA